MEQASDFIAGLANSLIFIGEFIGPTIGGYLIVLAKGDFSLATSYFALACTSIVLLCKSKTHYSAEIYLMNTLIIIVLKVKLKTKHA